MKTWLEISKSNLLHNVREITKRLDKKTRFMAVIKSNAYGHGTGEIARILLENTNEVTPPNLPLNKGRKRGFKKIHNELWFGVDSIWEARTLTSPTVQTVGLPPILVLGYTPREELKNIPKNVRLTIGSLEALQDAARSHESLKIHLKIETGTMRQGIRINDLNNVIRILKNSRNLIMEGISSHFAEAEVQPSTAFTQRQLQIFYDALKFLEKQGYKNLIRHIACSAAASHVSGSQFNMVRTGINLYGLQSIDKRTKEQKNTKTKLLNLKPVLTWKTMAAQVKEVKKGETIGYGRSAKMPYDGQIVILPVGYWDGYDRKLSSAGAVLINGKRCSIIGRICMNMCMALLPKNLKATLEDEVVLIGKQGNAQVTADELAEKIGTINYEVVTRINPLISKIIV